MTSRAEQIAAQLDAAMRELRWPEPGELRAEPLPPWPEKVFPPWADRFGAEYSRAMCAPRAMLDGWIFAALSVAAGGRLLVVPWEGWTEPVTLYVAVVGPPGAKKSPTIVVAMAPLHEMEKRRQASATPLVVEARAKREIAEKRMEKVKRLAADPTATDDARRDREREATQLAAELAKPAPVMPRLIAGDATPEALAALLADQGERLALLSGETALFGHAAGRYSDDPAIEVLLSAHARERVPVDRIGRPPLVLNAPMLTVGVGCQPAVIAKARRHDGRGLLARFLWIAPDHVIGWRDTTAPAPIDPLTVSAYAEGLRRVERLCFDLQHSRTLRLGDHARSVFEGVRAQLESERREGGSLAELDGWAAKADGLVLRIAALLHVAWGHDLDDQIEGETIARAFAVVKAATAHARRVLLDAPEEPRRVTCARRLREWLADPAADAPRERFTTRDATTALRHYGVDRRETEAVIDVLVRHDIVRPLGPVHGQRTDTSWWAAHPALVGGRKR